MTKYSPSFDVGRLLISTVKSMPADLATVGMYAIASTLLLSSVSLPIPIRALVAFPLLLFVPGYVVVATVYPGSSRRTGDRDRFESFPTTISDWGNRSRTLRRDQGLAPLERVVLSFGMTVVLLPLVGGVLWALFGRVSGSFVLFALTTLVFLLLPSAAARRTALPDDDRFAVINSWHLPNVRRWVAGDSSVASVVNVLLVVGSVMAISTLSYAFLVPAEGESYTTAMLLTEQGGDYVAAEYPSSFQPGESRQLTVQLTSHERRETSYTVVVATERIVPAGSELSVLERDVLDRLHVTLAPGETVRMTSNVAPRMVGNRLRLSYYVYRGEAPDVPEPSTSYRHLYLWITVAEDS